MSDSASALVETPSPVQAPSPVPSPSPVESPSYGKVWADIALGYGLLASVFVGMTWLGRQPSLAVRIAGFALASLLLGLTLHYLSLFLHAGGHFNLARKHRRNDHLTNLLFGGLLLSDIRQYRAVHFEHHIKLGQPDDPEAHYKYRLSVANFLRYFLLIEVLKRFRSKKKATSETRSCWPFAAIAFAFLAWQLFFFVLSMKVGGLLAYGAWLLAFFSWTPVITWLRTFSEHPTDGRGETQALNFAPSAISLFMGAAGFRCHGDHHEDMSIHYTILERRRPRAARFGFETYEKRLLSSLGK